MFKSETLECPKCGDFNNHLIGTMKAVDDDNYNLVALTIDEKHVIKCTNKKKYPYRSQGNIHLLFVCESGCLFAVSFDGHKGNMILNQNEIVEELVDTLGSGYLYSHEISSVTEKPDVIGLRSSIDHELIKGIERFLT